MADTVPERARPPTSGRRGSTPLPWSTVIDETTVRARLAEDELQERLAHLGFHDDDAIETVEAAAAVRRRPSQLRTIARSASLLVEGINKFRPGEAPDPWEELPSDREDLALLALLATVPEVRAEHARRRIPTSISWDSLADLGQQVHVNRLTHGRFGLDTYGWMRTAWSGGLMWLGRLQFVPKPTTAGWVLDVHIPATTALTPESVDASFAAAAPFFARHFPEYPATSFACTSWMLDPTLAEVLPETSNLSRFQRRWTLHGSGYPADSSVLYFAFRRRVDPEEPVDLDALTPATSLQRIVVERMRQGKHWSVFSGTAPLPEPAATSGADPQEPPSAVSG